MKPSGFSPHGRNSPRICKTSAQFHLFAGSLLQKEGKNHAALSEFRKALLLPEDNITMFILSFIHEVATPEEEVDACRERLRSHPGESLTVSRLGAVLRSQGKTDDEIALYREVIGRNPELPEIHGLFARALDAQGKSAAARTEFATEISLLSDIVRQNPQLADAREKLAIALIEADKWDEGLDELHRAARLDPGKTARARSLSTSTYVEKSLVRSPSTARTFGSMQPMIMATASSDMTPCFSVTPIRPCPSSARRHD